MRLPARTFRRSKAARYNHIFESTVLNYYNYFTEIEDTFVRRRGKHLFLSPLDWAMIDGWKERGVPLHIVLRAIESVFDVHDRLPPAQQKRTIKSLFYCREEVEAQYTEWLASQAGKHTDADKGSDNEFSPQAIREHIDKVIAQLRGVTLEDLSEGISRAIDRLVELRENVTSDAGAMDASLGDIEKLLERSILSDRDPVHLKMLEKATAAELRSYRREMTAESYKTTFDLMLLKRLREDAGIPRLGLFYI